MECVVGASFILIIVVTRIFGMDHTSVVEDLAMPSLFHMEIAVRVYAQSIPPLRTNLYAAMLLLLLSVRDDVSGLMYIYVMLIA